MANSTINTPVPALFVLVFVPTASLHVLIPVNELARDAMGQVFQTTKSVLIDADDAISNNSLGKIHKTTLTAPFGYAGSRFTIININVFQP